MYISISRHAKGAKLIILLPPQMEYPRFPMVVIFYSTVLCNYYKGFILSNTHSEVIEEQKKVKERQERANQFIQKNKAIKEKLNELRNNYLHLINPNNNLQARGS
jgi:uncharacterized membrane protein (DUF106 family)